MNELRQNVDFVLRKNNDHFKKDTTTGQIMIFLNYVYCTDQMLGKITNKIAIHRSAV